MQIELKRPAGVKLLTGGKLCPADLIVTPVLQHKTVTENGMVTPDAGFAGLSGVQVSVAGGGACTGSHIIQVDTLPTENIDKNAVYLCGGAYYQYAKEFVDLIQDGMSYRDLFDGSPILFVIVPTTPTAFDGIELAIYYVEDEGRFYFYEPYGGLNYVGDDVIVIDSIEDAGDEGYYAVIQNRFKKYFVPTGTFTITENGMHDVAAYAKATVDVPVPDGYVIPTGTKSITENGTHDVSGYASAEVNVPGEVLEAYDGTITIV